MARAAQRRPEVLDLRIRGLSFRRIGRALGVSHVQAWRDYEQAMAELAAVQNEKAEQARGLELERLDWMLEKLSGRIETGEPAAVAVALRLAERRAALLGLDLATVAKDAGGVGSATVGTVIVVTADADEARYVAGLKKARALIPDGGSRTT